ncbi:MAG: 4'-phosphopantetheinyl transferase superfamily protein [Methylohalobius sp.]|nr:4'-phosphopantetheinyl transferase superfamily protein [Methylohalobius sp.]
MSNFSLPRADEVILWRMSLLLPAQDLALCQEVLSREEWLRVERLLQPINRRRYIACWGQVRWLLSLILGVRPQALEFTRGTWGKPYLPESFGLAFNLSHSGDWLWLGVARDRELGVDIELIRPLAGLERLARRCLTSMEWEAWQKLPEPKRLGAFFRFWTLKEALAKASGQGLRLGVSNCAFVLGLGPVQVPEACAPAASWQVQEWVKEEFCAALCARPRGFCVAERQLSLGWISAAVGRCKGREWG